MLNLILKEKKNVFFNNNFFNFFLLKNETNLYLTEKKINFNLNKNFFFFNKSGVKNFFFFNLFKKLSFFFFRYKYSKIIRFFLKKKKNSFYKEKYVFFNNQLMSTRKINRIVKNRVKNTVFLHTNITKKSDDIVFCKEYTFKGDPSTLFFRKKKMQNGRIIAHNTIVEFLNFRFRNFTSLIRNNFFWKEYIMSVAKAYALILSVQFHRGYVLKLINAFAILLMSKDLNYFSFYIKKLIGGLSRTEQKNFFYTFSIISNLEFRAVLRRFNVYGFFLKTTGKIGGYVGDRTKTFSMLYGMCSKSIKFYKYNYNQFFIRTTSGAIGVKILLIFKK